MHAELIHDTTEDYTYEKKNYGGAGDREWTRTCVRLQLGEHTLIHEEVVVDREEHMTPEEYRAAALEQGARQVAAWFDRVERLMDKLENL